MKKINFGKQWEFSLNSQPMGTLDIPHDFSISQNRRADAPCGKDGGYFPGGYGEYKKTFTAKQNKKYFFMSDGAFGITEVSINNNVVLINKYGYNGFYADLTDYLHYGEDNILIIRVNNKNQPNARWYTGSGLYRDVYLCECGESYLDPYGPFVYTEQIFEKDARMASEVRFFAEKNGEACLDFEIFEDGKNTPIIKFSKYVYAERGENKATAKFQIRNAKIWDIDSPSLYNVKVTLSIGKCTDTETSVFGVRTIYLDNQKGLYLNGKQIKLRGGCIHHDHGPIGASSYPDAEYRRVAKMKEAGFNAIRCTHNPQSSNFYDACDRLGMLVIDEFFDYWTDGKRVDDFHIFFEDIWAEQVNLIVRRDRCHPSIILWSSGNEIPQKAGHAYGYRIAKNIADLTRSIDASRPITHALCSFYDKQEFYKEEVETEGYGADVMDFWGDKTKYTADTTDVIGYNYKEYRIDRDIIRFPQRLYIVTESFPLCAYTTTKQVDRTPQMIGDCVWTAWDYFGETGLGHTQYKGKIADGLLTYPYHIANCGDFDICGFRKPQSYYREIAFGLRKDPYIAVRHPKDAGEEYSISQWGFYDGVHSWNWPEYENKPIEVYVFGECDEMALEINGKEAGRLPRTENGVYFFKTVYHGGEVTAKAITGGNVVGISTLKTEGKAEKISLTVEKNYLAKKTKKPNQRLIFVDVEITDKDGLICSHDERNVKYEVSGADIIGIGSGALTSEEPYVADQRCVCEGKGLVILMRHEDAEKITLCATADGLPSVKTEIK